MKRFLSITALLLLCACKTSEGIPEYVTIESIIDPITFRTEDGDVVRLIGLRSPSVGQTVECFGKEALEIAESLIGKEVRLEEEPLLTIAEDGAYPRYIWLEDESAPPPAPEPPTETGAVLPMPEEEEEEAAATETGALTASGAVTASGSVQEEETPEETEEPKTNELLINEKSLELGIAFPMISQEMKYGERMLSSVRYALATNRGLWGACDVENQETPQGTWFYTKPLDSCVIKGKVSSDGKKIYRTPECSGYADTMVIKSVGGKWFCAADLAEDEGFEKGEDCPE